MINVAQPQLLGNEREYVLDCLDSTWISSSGKYIDAFEAKFAEFCGTKFALTANNGTTALHLALLALDLQPGDEVIIPTLTYIATANAVAYCGAIPVLADAVPGSMALDPEDIRQRITSRTKGIIAVHLYGHPSDMDSINEIAAEHGLWVVEDAAEAHGAEVRGRKVGSLSNVGVFSFFGNKIITTGEGGMLTTNDPKLADRIRLLRSQGMDPKRRYWFEVVGYNYRMTNIQAAIGLAQLEKIDEALHHREKIAMWYNAALQDLTPTVYLPQQETWAKHVYWMYTVNFLGQGEVVRDAVMQHLAAEGIETRPVFYPMHILPPYKSSEIFRISEEWAKSGINLPTHLGLKKEDIDYIAQKLKDAVASAIA